MEIMNEEKMYPRGKGIRGNDFWLSWRDGTHRKTNRYIDPSKHVCVRPRTRRRGSVTKTKSGRENEKITVAIYTYLYERYSKLVLND
jgi:hypothetical protein